MIKHRDLIRTSALELKVRKAKWLLVQAVHKLLGVPARYEPMWFRYKNYTRPIIYCDADCEEPCSEKQEATCPRRCYAGGCTPGQS